MQETDGRQTLGESEDSEATSKETVSELEENEMDQAEDVPDTDSVPAPDGNEARMNDEL